MPLHDSNERSLEGFPRQFMTTHWSAVVAAQKGNSPRGERALAELCQNYWYPLYAFIRKQGHSPHDAEDLAQSFFARLLEKNYLAAADRDKGRFRSFLLVALKRFLANEWDRKRTLKRGGTARMISFDGMEAESRYLLESAHSVTAEKLYEQRWAQTLLDRVLARLQREYTSGGKAVLFKAIRNSLGRRQGNTPYAELGAQLHMTEAAVKMAVQRLRARYRDYLREEISRTVCHSREVDEEIRHLFAIFDV